MPLIVSFSGIDGAGKSSQIARLSHALEAEGCQIALVSFWDDIVVLKGFREKAGHQFFKGDRGVGLPSAPIVRRDKNVQSPILTLLRMGFYLLDGISLRRNLRGFRHAKHDQQVEVVIFDRYLYDELANIKTDSFLKRLYLRSMLCITAKPHIAFVLDASPESAFARKPEYPLDFLHSNRKAYLDLAVVASMAIIAPTSIEQAHAEILRIVQAKRCALFPRKESGRISRSISPESTSK